MSDRDPAALAATLAPVSPDATLHAPNRVAAAPTGGAAIQLHETIGEGGMGIVRRGTQAVLAREVAVKSLRGAAADPEALAKIVREALVMGRLEHPNVVPVYTIDVDDLGLPRIVMKRVQGDEWSSLLADDAAVRARSDGDPLYWHLRVFVQVAHALAYAHSRGIVHLDLKPSNVMLGPFGEVYLLDWGIAHAIDDAVDGRIPRLRDNHTIIGTPRYLAPEVLEAAGPALGVHTDVYLLGATLFEIVMGEPPHAGESMAEVLREILEVEPVVDRECPAELAALVHRCLARAPSERPSSVMEVARAIEAILEHRASTEVCDEADAQRRKVEALIDGAGVDADEDAVYQAFGAARFGYGNALAGWPDNAAAQAGLATVTRAVVRWELARGRVDAAAAALGPSIDAPELRAEIEAAQRERSVRHARLSALEREHDASVGQRTRLFFLGWLTLIWVAVPAVASIGGHDPTTEPISLVTFAGVAMLALIAGFAVWARDSLSKTLINRGIVASFSIALAVQVALGLLAGPLGLDMAQLQTLVMLEYTATATFVTLLLERRIWPTALAFAVGTVVVAFWPSSRNIVLSLTNLASGINSGVLWRMSMAEIRGPR